ncbi:DUF5906 domain-containing protein [uncultured Deefgea sp.]|uniref:DUF5906 domain-containing protein n=1 Tax=uncultured Deefgea sp. TaxID=1304914 RepID=UPI00259A9C21|nr:DUF5906 domain-containing protein [uncultured Deefgea sp.]
MMNYPDVLSQLQGFGLDVTVLEVGPNPKNPMGFWRVPMKGEGKEERGWYLLHEVSRDDGQKLLIGTYGVWRGNEKNAQKVTLNADANLSAEQMAAANAKHKEALAQAERERKIEADRAAKVAVAEWANCSEVGESAYLDRKNVAGIGVRYDADGNVIIPLLDIKGKIRALQKIHPQKNPNTGNDKEFWPKGMSWKDSFFQMGLISNVVIVVEGYATGASIYQATGVPVVVAFVAGNLVSVAKLLHTKYPKAKILIAADDDYAGKCQECKVYTPVAKPLCLHCGKPHNKTNAGMKTADAAALSVNGAWLLPVFSDERPSDKKGPNDFNDLHALEGMQAVREQIETKLTALGWVGQAAQPRARPTEGGGDLQRLAIADTEEMFDRFALIYAANSVCFDHHHRLLVKLSDVRDACADKNFVREWQADIKRRQMVLMDQVGFDPTESNSQIICNLWGGWPTTPKAGVCQELLDLLWYLCSREPNCGEIYNWILKWLAYPIQNPGAKMQTALVLHGPQGTGKNLFFDAIQTIYGEYGLTVDQAALEDNHNDWAGKKLFLIADEVVAQQEMHHIKNRLKNFVTCRTIRINPKHVTAHTESNHVNVVFLSNEAKPIVLERDDRRYCVVYAPKKMEAKYYASIAAEIEAGGVAALHDFLLQVDLTDFNTNSKPPMTLAKQDLIALSLEGWERFAVLWSGGDLNHIGILDEPCDVDTLYQAYRSWSEQDGQRYTPPKNIFSGNLCKLDGFMKRERQHVHIGFAKRQVTMLYPPGKTEPPSGKTLGAWNTECITRLKDAIEHAKTGDRHEFA